MGCYFGRNKLRKVFFEDKTGKDTARHLMEVYRFICRGDAYSSRQQPSGRGECTCKLRITAKYGFTSLGVCIILSEASNNHLQQEQITLRTFSTFNIFNFLTFKFFSLLVVLHTWHQHSFIDQPSRQLLILCTVRGCLSISEIYVHQIPDCFFLILLLNWTHLPFFFH